MGPAPIRILLVEDSAADAELEMRELKRAGLRVDYRRADTEAACREEIARFKPEVILSDFAMPHFDGMSALATARELAPGTPFIFVSGTLGEDYAIRALKNGATDYVLKTNLVRLPPAIERALSDAEQRRRLERLSRLRQFSSQMNWALVRIREREELFAGIGKIAVEVGGLSAARIGTRDESGALAWRAWFPRQPEDGSKASFPLWVEGREAGLLEFAGFFDEDQAAVLHELAANVAFALELMAKQDRLNYLALYDPLTGLANRALFHERLAQALASAGQEKSRLALIVTDLDRFKAINDTLGSPVGDAVLKEVAGRLAKAAGDKGAARLGGNVFGVMVAGISGAEEVARRLERANVFGQPASIQQHEIQLAAKTGIAVYPEDGADADALFRNAEAALKRAKETGERYLFYAPSINARVSEQVELEGRLRKALDRGELFLHFQPKYDLASQRMVGMEALMRWQGGPDGALVSPALFVPVLEQTGLIFEAGQQALAAAARAYRDWHARGLKPPRIAVNVSALQLRRRSFVEDVRRALGEPGADGAGVDLEVTESLLMAEVEESIGKLRELRAMGMRMALDDFGTGYSSLAYLSKLPLDTLKVDRSFVRDMTEKTDHTSIVSAIISLAQALRLKVVAEGVETEAQAQLLRLLRCDEAQGFLYSKPLPPASLEDLLKAL